MKAGKYYLRARLFPALLTAIPAILLYYFLLGTKLNDAMKYAMAVPLTLHVTVSSAVIYAFTLLDRFLGKEIFQRFYFSDEQRMPSTNFMLLSDQTLSVDMKKKIKIKLQGDFGIKLLSDREEANNNAEARKQIVFAVSKIKNKTRGNGLLLQHNYEYGFIRNFLGGCVFAVVNCMFNMVIFYFYFKNDFAFKLNFGIFFFYLLFILFSRWLIHRHGKNYAKVLYEQYLDTQ